MTRRRFLADFQPPATSLICAISNVGSRTIKIVSTQIFDLFGNPESIVSGCGVTLAPGVTRNVNTAHASGRGVFEFSGSPKDVRGACLLFGANGLVGTMEMR